MVRQSKLKLENLVDISDPVAISAYKGPGHHVAQYLFISKDDYSNRFQMDLKK
jgi:hypothetical protein